MGIDLPVLACVPRELVPGFAGLMRRVENIAFKL
jgi:hypothetical protein